MNPDVLIQEVPTVNLIFSESLAGDIIRKIALAIQGAAGDIIWKIALAIQGAAGDIIREIALAIQGAASPSMGDAYIWR